jgi:hypothetical protein
MARDGLLLAGNMAQLCLGTCLPLAASANQHAHITPFHMFEKLRTIR